MAAIDYYNIKAQIKSIIENDGDVSPAVVEIDKDLWLSPEMSPGVYIYTTGRSAPSERQQLRAGRGTVYEIRHTLIVLHHSFESIEKASELRDDFLGALEVVLMKDRTLNGAVETMWLEGGDMGAAPLNDEGAGPGFVADAYLDLVTIARATV